MQQIDYCQALDYADWRYLANLLCMQLVTVDDSCGAPNNVRMNRREIAKRVRLLRVGKELTQAALAKKARLAIGTLQGLEAGNRETMPTNIEKIAKVLGTSLAALTSEGDAVQSTDPVLAGLNRDEDLVIARDYHNATTARRQAVQILLRDEDADRLIALLIRLRSAGPDVLRVIETVIAKPELVATLDRFVNLDTEPQRAIALMIEGAAPKSLEQKRTLTSTRDRPTKS
jgi:transcriptional regulator with XRE-family HTH domain